MTYNDLRIEFAALNFLYPENNRYMYFMAGEDKDTVLLSNYRTVEYKKLRPGNYRFWFTGSNNDGLWNPEGKTLEIHIKPPFSRSVFTFLIYGILLLALMAAYTRRHFNKLNKEKK